MRLMLDEDSQGYTLIRRLRQTGHDVLTVNEAGLRASPDVLVFETAVATKRAILTRNIQDFRYLHKSIPQHSGILAIHQYDDSSSNMLDEDIARAIANIDASGWDISGEFVSLNSWNYSRA